RTSRGCRAESRLQRRTRPYLLCSLLSRGRRPRITLTATVGSVLDPVIAAVRRAVRESLAPLAGSGSRVLVALSGGADSLALAAATAYEASRAGLEVSSATIDHGLQS